MDTDAGAVSLRQVDQRWELTCPARPELVAVPNAYLGYLTDRNYSPRTVRTYGFGLVAFCRWAQSTGQDVEAVSTDDLLSFLSACRQQVVAGRGGPNVVDLAGRRTDRLAPASVNLRLAAIAGMYEYLAMRDPSRISPVPAAVADPATTSPGPDPERDQGAAGQPAQPT